MSRPRVEEVSDSEAEAASDPSEGDIDDFADANIMRRIVPTGGTGGGAAASPSSRPPPPPPPAGSSGFQCLYPVYFDATRSRAQGRRVGAALAVRSPLARDVADACARLCLATLLEPDKLHPKDWANPGRVRVGLKQQQQQQQGGGGVVVRNKHHLYVLVARYLATHPTSDASPGLRLGLAGAGPSPWPRPAVPRGWKVGDLLPWASAAMTGGGVSDNLFRDMMREMQAAGDDDADADADARKKKPKDKKQKARA